MKSLILFSRDKTYDTSSYEFRIRNRTSALRTFYDFSHLVLIRYRKYDQPVRSWDAESVAA